MAGHVETIKKCYSPILASRCAHARAVEACNRAAPSTRPMRHAACSALLHNSILLCFMTRQIYLWGSQEWPFARESNTKIAGVDQAAWRHRPHDRRAAASGTARLEHIIKRQFRATGSMNEHIAVVDL